MSTPTDGQDDLDALFGKKQPLSPESKQAITSLAADAAAGMSANLGTPVSGIPFSEQIYVTFLVDNTPSIGSFKQTVVDGCRKVLDDLNESKQFDNILVAIYLLNGGLLLPYRFLEDVLADPQAMLNDSNYVLTGMTPLYDATYTVLATVLDRMREVKEEGASARFFTVIVTDGEDNDSHLHTLAELRAIGSDLAHMENHTFYAMGIGLDTATFTRTFESMGIPTDSIYLPGNDAKTVRNVFGVISKSVATKSQSATQFKTNV